MTVRDGQERVAKLIAQKGWCSRREAERLIGAGQVMVAGKVVTDLGMRVPVDADITLKDRGQKHLAELVTVVLNKPIGIVSTQPEGDQVPAWTLLTLGNCMDPDADGVDEVLRQPWTCAVCGRLDQDSRGMLVMTQDGKLSRLITGGHAWSKQYEVSVDQDPSRAQVARLASLRRLDHDVIQPMEVRRLGSGRLEFILREGRKHQIRRACEIAGLAVTDLVRVRIGPWELGDCPPGKWRMVPREQVRAELAKAAAAAAPATVDAGGSDGDDDGA
jgi:23S rRNA pseudouridine2604 synthase